MSIKEILKRGSRQKICVNGKEGVKQDWGLGIVKLSIAFLN